jgi:hypothetical protein
VVSELFGTPVARRTSVVVAALGGLWAIRHDQTYAGLFAFLLAWTNFQEIQAERGGGRPTTFDVDDPRR